MSSFSTDNTPTDSLLLLCRGSAFAKAIVAAFINSRAEGRAFNVRIADDSVVNDDNGIFLMCRSPGSTPATNASIRRHSGCFCRWSECRRIFPDELLHTQRLLPRQCAHVIRRAVEAPRAMQIS